MIIPSSIFYLAGSKSPDLSKYITTSGILIQVTQLSPSSTCDHVHLNVPTYSAAVAFSYNGLAARVMAQRLELSTNLLNTALDRYGIICTRLRNQYAPGAGLQLERAHSELTDRIIAELSRIGEYETQIQYSKAIINKLHNISELSATMSINRFPSEILTRIFEYVIKTHPCPMAFDYAFQPSDKVAFRNDPIVLSHVCSHWRQIAISATPLWSHIDIYLTQPLIPVLLARLDAYLIRSSQSPLDLHIAEQVYRAPHYPSIDAIDPPADPVYLNLLTTFAPRIRSLTFIARHSVSGGNLVRSVLSTCFSNATPGILTHVTIHHPQGDTGARSIRPVFPVVHATTTDVQPHIDNLTGLPRPSAEVIWLHVRVLQLRFFRPEWTSKAFHGLTELRLVGGIYIDQSNFHSILRSSPRLRVLELDIAVRDYTPGDGPLTPLRLDELEILVIGGSKEEEVIPLLQSIDTGSKPISLSLVNPYLGTSDNFDSRDALAQFSARSNVARFNGHEFNNYIQLAEVLSLMPSVRAVGVTGIRCNAIDEESDLPLGRTFEAPYVINSSKYARFSWPSIERFIEKHSVQKLTLWRYDFCHCGLSDPGKETIPQNLYSICSEVNVVPDTDPNPIGEWT